MIFEGSRYEDNLVVRIKTATSATFPAIYPDPYADAQHFDFDNYQMRAGDRYDVIAARVYGDPELWWILARANPEVFYPDDIAFGTIIRVPRASSVL